MKCEKCGAILHYGANGVLLDEHESSTAGIGGGDNYHLHYLPTFMFEELDNEDATLVSIGNRVHSLQREIEELTNAGALIPVEPAYSWWHSVIFCRIQSYYADRYDDDLDSISYGDLENCPESQTAYVRVPYSGYSDYSGGSVERSNYRTLLREFPGVFVTSYGGHGTAELLFPLTYRGENRLEILDICKGLMENYPLYDEEDESQLVMDEAWESWEHFIKHDLYRDLPEMCESPEAMEDMLAEIDEEEIKQLFYEITGEQNEYPYWESGSSGVHFPCYKDTAEEMYERLWAQRLDSINYQIEGQQTLFSNELPGGQQVWVIPGFDVNYYYEMGQ